MNHDNVVNLSDDKLKQLGTAILHEQRRRKQEVMRQQEIALQTQHPETYNDGYRTGRRWGASWQPGGPFDRRLNGLWQKGFAEGLAENFRVNPAFEEWYTEGYHDYVSFPGELK